MLIAQQCRNFAHWWHCDRHIESDVDSEFQESFKVREEEGLPYAIQSLTVEVKV